MSLGSLGLETGSRIALLLVNLGTPESHRPHQVGEFLKEFLMDPLVLDIPPFWRNILVNWLVVPRRKYKSSEAYKKIWTPQGSPLLHHSLGLRDELKTHLPVNFNVDVGMRYGRPSIEQALKNLLSDEPEKILVLPLYPQYALSSTQTALNEVHRCLKALGSKTPAFHLPFFFWSEAFLQGYAFHCKQHLKGFRPDHILFSYHGLPLRHCQKVSTKGYCQEADCCERILAHNEYCYRAQCVQTTRQLQDHLGLSRSNSSFAFQSRFGGARWLSPHLEDVVDRLARGGVRKLAVICPSFVTDCLETLEEIGIREREKFRRRWGGDLHLVPSLNASPNWSKAIVRMIEEESWRQLR